MDKPEKKHIMHLTQEEAEWVIGMDRIQESRKHLAEDNKRFLNHVEVQNYAMQTVLELLVQEARKKGVEVKDKGELLGGPLNGHFLLMGKWYHADEVKGTLSRLVSG